LRLVLRFTWLLFPATVFAYAIVLYVCRFFQQFLFGYLYFSSFDDGMTLICFSFLVWGWALFPFSGEVRRISHRTFKLMVAVRVSSPSLFRSVTKWCFIWLVDTVESSLSVLSGSRYLVIRVFLSPSGCCQPWSCGFDMFGSSRGFPEILIIF
jgi:hypothetical protein